MAGPKVYMAEPKGHFFDWILAKGWVVMAGHNVYMAEPNICVFDFSLVLVFDVHHLC
jgi:hypothetical protein